MMIAYLSGTVSLNKPFILSLIKALDLFSVDSATERRLRVSFYIMELQLRDCLESHKRLWMVDF